MRLNPLLLLLLLGCDKEWIDARGPEASGKIYLNDTEIDPRDFKIMEIRLYESKYEFDLSEINERGQLPQNRYRTEDLHFPVSYNTNFGLGYSYEKTWRVLAWLARDTDPLEPQPGEYYGYKDFDLLDCNWACKDDLIAEENNYSCYCGLVEHIDVGIVFKK